MVGSSPKATFDFRLVTKTSNLSVVLGKSQRILCLATYISYDSGSDDPVGVSKIKVSRPHPWFLYVKTDQQCHVLITLGDRISFPTGLTLVFPFSTVRLPTPITLLLYKLLLVRGRCTVHDEIYDSEDLPCVVSGRESSNGQVLVSIICNRLSLFKLLLGGCEEKGGVCKGGSHSPLFPHILRETQSHESILERHFC